MATTTTAGSAQQWGPLWGARPREWAASEELQRPTYEEAIRRVGVSPGQRVLDVGCGAGVFLRMVADNGAVPFGLDASEALVELARERVPGADVRVGEMERLPYANDSFDLVTGFNSYFFAADMVAALRESGRVAKRGAPVVIQVWGPPDHNDLEAMKRVARPYAPPPPPGAPKLPPLWRPGALEELAQEAGLTPGETFDIAYSFEYPDEEALARLLTAPMGLAVLAGDREPQLRRDIVDALAPHRRPDGGYRLRTEFHCLVARASA